MQSIKKSECPKELEPADRRSAVNVNLIRRSEKYPVSSMLCLSPLHFSTNLHEFDGFSLFCSVTFEYSLYFSRTALI